MLRASAVGVCSAYRVCVKAACYLLGAVHGNKGGPIDRTASLEVVLVVSCWCRYSFPTCFIRLTNTLVDGSVSNTESMRR